MLAFTIVVAVIWAINLYLIACEIEEWRNEDWDPDDPSTWTKWNFCYYFWDWQNKRWDKKYGGGEDK